MSKTKIIIYVRPRLATLWDWVDREAERRGVSRSQLVTEALSAHRDAKRSRPCHAGPCIKDRVHEIDSMITG